MERPAPKSATAFAVDANLGHGLGCVTISNQSKQIWGNI